MTSTPRIALPELAASQAQKHVTMNEALIQIDALIDLYVTSNALTVPPGAPADGDTYIVAASATGAWAGYDGKIATALDGSWNFYAAFKGLVAYVASAADFLFYNGSAWVSFSSVMALQNLAMLGINTTADSTNKLAVKSAALLFDNIGNGVQTKLNKHAATDTASFLFQTNYSGRAEIGTTGDDNFHFKVSSDGATWHDALDIAASSGNVGLGNTGPSVQLHVGSGTNTTAPYGIQFGSDTSANIYRSGAGIVKTDGYFYGGTGLIGTICQFNTLYPLSGIDLTIETRPSFSNNILFKSNGTTPNETMRCNSVGHVLIGTTVDNGHLTVAGNVMPEADNTRNLGSSSFRFANAYFGGTVKSGSYTVATLPSASASGAGARAFVTDATATTFASIAAGGGTNKVPVVSDGTNWIIG